MAAPFWTKESAIRPDTSGAFSPAKSNPNRVGSWAVCPHSSSTAVGSDAPCRLSFPASGNP